MIQKKHLTQLILASLVAVSGNAVYAAEPSAISVDVNYWKPSVTGDSEMHMPNSSTINLKNDLGLDKKNSLSLTLNYKQDATHTWYIGGDGVDSKNSRTLAKAFSFNNTNYITGDNVSSELKVSHYQIGLRSNWSADSNFYTNYQLNRSSVKTTITDNTSRQSQNRDKDFTSLGIGLGWETRNPNKINFFAEINPLSLFNRSGYWEHKIGIKTPVSQNMNLTLGYKTENIQAGKDNANDRTNVYLRGMYFSLGGSF